MQNLTPLDMQTVQKFNTNMAIVFKQIKENQTIEIAHIEYLRNITAYFKKIYEEKDESLFGSYVKVENYINYKNNAQLQKHLLQSLSWFYAIQNSQVNLRGSERSNELQNIIHACQKNLSATDAILEKAINRANWAIIASSILSIYSSIALCLVPLFSMALLPPVFVMSILSLIIAFPLSLSLRYPKFGS